MEDDDYGKRRVGEAWHLKRAIARGSHMARQLSSKLQSAFTPTVQSVLSICRADVQKVLNSLVLDPCNPHGSKKSGAYKGAYYTLIECGQLSQFNSYLHLQTQQPG